MNNPLPALPGPNRFHCNETEDRNLKTFKLVFLNPEDETEFCI